MIKIFMITLSLLSALSEKFYVGDINIFIINLVFAIILILFGIFLGKFIKFALRKGIDKSGVTRTAKRSFIELLLSVIKWSIYILFFILALDQIGIPQLTNWITSTLVVVPALVGALLLISIGFAIATYLKDLTEESKIEGWEVLSKLFYYFIIYVFMIFALKTALISQDKNVVNVLIVIFTAIITTGLVFWNIKQK